jgi:DNA-binding MarR family transcriptional regulator
MPASMSVEELGTLLFRSRREIWCQASRDLEAEGESILVYQLLSYLVRLGASAQGEIASGIGQHPAGVCRLLADLEDEGLVRRARDPGDRRKVLVAVTPKGRARFKAANPILVQAIAQVLSPWSEDEREVLRGLLSKLVLTCNQT